MVEEGGEKWGLLVRWAVKEKRVVQGCGKMCGPFKRFETGLITLEPQISLKARIPFLARCPNVGKTQTLPLLVLRL